MDLKTHSGNEKRKETAHHEKKIAVLVILIIFCAAAVADTDVPAGDNPGSRIPMPDSYASDAALGEGAHRGLSEPDRQIVRNFIDEFKLIAAIPHPTKHEQALSDFLKGWAEARGYTVKQNEVYDLIFDVPATQGYEALPLTALQAHMDMVCIGADGKDYDPQKDPITVQFDLDAGTMTADGTSLGADDGAGVAMIMAIVDGGMDHGPLRVIFTVDEEVDMTGAMAITAEDLDGVRYLVITPAII